MTDEAGAPASGAIAEPAGGGRAERDTTAAVTQTLAGPASPLAVDIDGASSVAKGTKVKAPRQPGEARSLAIIFLAPAVILLAAVMVYPLIYTVVRSLFADAPAGDTGSFSWLHQYQKLFTDTATLRALKNNLIWLIVVPTLVTIFGLIFAVLSERVRWKSAFRLILFMPMAISSLAAGVTFGLIYSDQPSQGLANAITTGIHDTFVSTTGYPDLHASDTSVLTGSPAKGYTSVKQYSGTSAVLVPLTGLNLQKPPKSAKQATPASGSGLNGVVWNDFKIGGGGTKGAIDQGEVGVPGITVHAVQGGKTVATATTDDNGAFSFPKLTSGSYSIGLPAGDFTSSYAGLSWLGPNLITPAIILAYLWAWCGFAMVLLASGMSSISREALEAARMDGATEFQVFRKVTVPLLAPVLTVVLVTMIINVLKVFDLVYIISQTAGANGKYSNVLATQLYSSYGNLQYGAASAVGVVLVLLVLPAMIINIRRFRREGR